MPYSFKLALRSPLLAAIILFDCNAYALPFNPSPQSFENHMNQIRWDSGKKVRFSEFHECKYSKEFRANYADPRIEQSKDKSREILTYMNSRQLSPQEKSSLDAQYDYYLQTLPEQIARESGRTVESYKCYGYAAITDPRGTNVCQAYISYDSFARSYNYSPYNCRWQ